MVNLITFVIPLHHRKGIFLASLASGLLIAPRLAFAAANLSGSTNFTAADGARSYVEVGGAWNGSADVRASMGDTFSISLQNIGDQPASVIKGTVTLPSGFLYVANTVTGISGISATQVGTSLTFNISSATAISSGTTSTVSFGLVTSTSVAAGTYGLSYAFSYSTGTVGPLSQSIVVRAGASTLSFNPSNQTKSVNQTATWDVTVTNTGLGGLFDVPINESLINPNSSNSLQIVSITQSAPASPTAVGTSPTLTLPYLAPGISFTVHVTATVTGCSDITNNASTTDRSNATSKTASAQVTLDLQQPLIAYTPPTATLQYNGTTHVSFGVQNTGMGDATSLLLDTNFDTLSDSVTNVSAGWTYNPIGGGFSKTSSLINGSSTTLSFDLSAGGLCSATNNQIVHWTSQYNNVCGNTFATPSPISSVNLPTDIPTVIVAKSAAVSRLPVGNSSSYQVQLTAANTSNIGSDPVLVKDVLPSGITGVIVSTPSGTTFSCSGPCVAGSTLTWSVPLAQLGATRSLTINYTAPSNTCLGGTTLFNSAVVTSTSTQSCALNSSSSAGVLLINNPGASASLNIDPVPGTHGTTFETGRVDDGNGTRDAGEGEFIQFVSSYSFAAGYPGSWSGSTYLDNFAGLAGQTLVPGTLQASVDGGGFQSVPLANITQSTGSLNVTLDFLSGAGFANDANVASHSVIFQYKTVHPDSDLGGQKSRSLTQIATLSISGGTGTGSCGSGSGSFSQGTFYTIARAQLDVNLSGMPNAIDLCQVIPTTVSISNDNVEQASNVLLTVNTSGDYDFLSATAPVYGGDFTNGNITYTANGGVNPTFQYTPITSKIANSGTVFYYTRRKATSTTAVTPVSALVNFDDVQTSTSTSSDFSVTANAYPVVVRKANLSITMTPQNFAVVGSTAQWTVYVTNTGDGTAYSTSLQDSVPSAFTINIPATNAANPGFAVSVNGSTMTWNLGDIGAGQTVAIQPVVSPNGSTCSVPHNSNFTTSTWGCGGSNAQLINSFSPDFSFPSGQLQILHDSSGSFLALCGTGTIVIIVKNTGSTHVTNVLVNEVLNPSSTGVDLVSGSVQYSTDGGSTWNAAGDPTGNGTSGTPYVFSSTQAAALADLATQVEGGVSEVRIRFSISSNENANGSAPQITASGAATLFCGGAATSPGTLFTVPRQRPDFSVTKVGRNVTAGQAGYSSTVYASPGDTIDWRVTLQNNGNYSSFNTRLADVFPNAGGTVQGTLNGTGYASFTLANNTPVPVPLPTDRVLASSAVVYSISQTLGASCVNQSNTADVTWGCTNNGSNSRSNLTSPTSNTGSASLVMLPSFSSISQGFTALNGGRTQVSVTITNTGSTAQNLAVTDTLPTGQKIDLSYSPALSSTGNVTGVVVDSTSLTVPIFNLTGTLAHGDSITIIFRIIQTGNFDTTGCRFQNPETVGNGCDPTLPPTGSNLVTVGYQDSCGNVLSASNSATLDPQTPDVDLTVIASNRFFTAGSAYTFTYTLINNGDAGSVADHITFLTSLGSGFTSPTLTVTAPGTGGTGGVCTSTCTLSQIGTLGFGQSAVITLVATAQNNGGPTSALGTAIGEVYTDSGGATGNYYSFDQAQPAALGFSTSKTFVSQSESFTSGTNIPIGGESKWKLNATWFGNDPASGVTISGIDVRDTLPAGLGFVSYSTTTNNSVSITSVSSPTVLNAGRIDFFVAPLTSSGVFEVNLIGRVLNIAGNTNGKTLTNSLGLSFVASSTTFASNNATDGFGGSQSTLHAQHVVTVVRPSMTYSKLVRNVTTSSAFGATATGDAGDTLEYKLTLQNNGSAPAFDLVATDVLQTTKLVIVDGSTDGVDNDGDGLIDSADLGGEGSYDLVHGSVTFSDPNTNLASGSGLGRLNTGQTVTLLYRAITQNTVVPGDALLNQVNFRATTLPGATGNETSPTAAPGATGGEAVLTSTASATMTVSSLTFTKSILNTAVNNDASPNVYVGEQVQFQLQTILPEGTVPSFVITDKLPVNLSLVQTPAPALGSAISGCNSPTITPASLPASDSPQLVQWNFGTCSVASGSPSAQKTVTITYLTQVINSTSNINGISIVNQSSYSFTGAPGNSASVALTVQESSVTLSEAVSTAHADAGDVLTYTVTLQNIGAAPAYDVNFLNVLPTNVTYNSGTTNTISGSPILEPDVSGSSVTWGRGQSSPQSLTINAGGTLQFTFQGTLQDAVLAGQTLTNIGKVDWTSIPGSPGSNLGVALGSGGASLGERVGSTGVNNYLRATSTATVVGSSVTVTKTATGDTLAGGGFRVGDIVTYSIVVNVPEATMQAASIQDTLPTGLAFLDSQAPSPASGSNFTYAGPVAPVAASTGTITWNFGTLVNTGNNDPSDDHIALVYRARVIDTSGIAATPTTQSLANAAAFKYTGGAGATQVNALAAAISVKQPGISLDKALRAGQTVNTNAGLPIHYRLTVSNTGDAPAYDAIIHDTLPLGVRTATPTVIAATLNGVSTVLSSSSYVPSTGALDFYLTDSQPILSAQSLVLDYDVRVDSPIANGMTVTNAAVVPSFESKASTDTVQRRTYAPVGPVSAPTVTAQSAVVSVAKTVNVSTAAPSDSLHYSITLTNSGSVDASSTSFSDTLDASIEPGSMANVSVTPNTGVRTISGTGGANGTGLLSIANMTIPSGQSVVVAFDAKIAASAHFGSAVHNQALINVPGFSNPFLTNITTTTLQTAPILHMTKVATAASPLTPGATVLFTLTMTNGGSEKAISASLADAIPANTHYVANTTTLNNTPAADVSGAPPFVSGFAVSASASAVGEIPVGSTAVVTFVVSVDSSVQNGTVISNQATLSASGFSFGPLLPELSDDPALPGAHDPTQNVVGLSPLLHAAKTVTDLNGGAVAAGDVLRYDIRIRNSGATDAAAVKIVDVIPSNASYVPGSLTFDSDGSGPGASVGLTDAADGDAGDYGSTTPGAITVAVGTLPAASEASLSFQVTVASSATSGTLISNQGTVTATNSPAVLTDGDGDESNGAQPTRSVVGSLPLLQFSKQLRDLNGGSLQPGDTIEFVLSAMNIGVSSATNVKIADPAPPAGTVYVAGSTLLNGQVQADDAGVVSPVARSGGWNIGALRPSQTATVQFRTVVVSTAATGQTISNTAMVSADTVSSSPATASDSVSGAQGVANVSGYIWRDANHDRTFNAGEQPQPGWLVEAFRFGDLLRISTTDANGYYQFLGLPSGSGYELRFLNPVNHAVFGSPVSAAPGVDLSRRTIGNLTLGSGDFLLNQSLPLDPSGIVYDAATRQPLAGAVVRMVGPGGADVSSYLLAGQQGQVTGSDGYYELDLIGGFPMGLYTIVLTPPANYSPTWPSALLPPHSGALTPPVSLTPTLVVPNDSAPSNSDTALYYTSFNLASGDSSVLNNHLPVDPVLSDALFVSKTAQVATASRGELVPYTITVTNRLNSSVVNINLEDQMPPGFQYRTGTARLNAIPFEPTRNGRALLWGPLTFTAHEVKTFKVLLIVGSGVGEGKYVNQAWAVNNALGTTASNVSQAVVRIVPDPTFDCTDIIGKVFDDLNSNGYPDPGEPGVPGARVANVNGLVTVTDSYGRYHIACAAIPDEALGENYVLKVDPRTIPQGYHFTTENPYIKRLTRGKMAKMDFGIGLTHAVRLELTPESFHPEPALPPVTPDQFVTEEKSEQFDPVYFDNAFFQLTPEHIAKLRAGLARINQMDGVSNVHIQVEGHTDTSPITGHLRESLSGNQELSVRRARSVAHYLKDQLHLPSSMISFEGYGETYPVAPDTTAEGRAKNRRAEIRVLYRFRRMTEAGVSPTKAEHPTSDPQPQEWHAAVEDAIDLLKKRQSALRLAFCPAESPSAAKNLTDVRHEVEQKWLQAGAPYPLAIQVETTEQNQCATKGATRE